MYQYHGKLYRYCGGGIFVMYVNIKHKYGHLRASSYVSSRVCGIHILSCKSYT